MSSDGGNIYTRLRNGKKKHKPKAKIIRDRDHVIPNDRDGWSAGIDEDFYFAPFLYFNPGRNVSLLSENKLFFVAVNT